MAETFRSGLESVADIQIDSAISLGMNRAQVMWYVIIPQAVSVSVPAFVANIIFFVERNQCIQCNQFNGFDVYGKRFDRTLL